MKVRAQILGQEPRGDMEVLIVRFGEVLAPGAGLFEGVLLRGCDSWGEERPSVGAEFVVLARWAY